MSSVIPSGRIASVVILAGIGRVFTLDGMRSRYRRESKQSTVRRAQKSRLMDSATRAGDTRDRASCTLSCVRQAEADVSPRFSEGIGLCVDQPLSLEMASSLHLSLTAQLRRCQEPLRHCSAPLDSCCSLCVRISESLARRVARVEGVAGVRARAAARVVRQSHESVVFALCGGVAALIANGFGVLVSLMPGGIRRIDHIGLDGYVLAACLALSTGTGLLFGLLPALYASRLDPGAALKESALLTTPSRRRIRGALIVAEVALSVALLAGAGLMMKTFLHLRPANPGFEPEGKLVATISLPLTQ